MHDKHGNAINLLDVYLCVRRVGVLQQQVVRRGAHVEILLNPEEFVQRRKVQTLQKKNKTKKY